MIRLLYLTDFTEQFAYRLLKGILDYSKTHERWIVMRVPHEYKKTLGMKNLVKWATEWKADVVIGTFDPDDNIELFREKGIVVLAQDYISKFKDVPNITGDDLTTGSMAAEYFLAKGFKHFGFFGHNGVTWSDSRRDGYQATLQKAGFEHLHEYEHQSLDKRWHYQAQELSDWLYSLPKPIAIMCCDDNQGAILLEGCNACGIKVPDEISVIGVDNDSILDRMIEPTLSSIDVDIERGGAEAAAMSSRMVHFRNYKGHDILLHPVAIKTRLSSSAYATKDTAVLQALQFIQKNINRKIGVQDVIDEVPLSRRLLEIRFKQVTSESIYNYISRQRIERFASLLLSSSDSVSSIAQNMGEEDSNSITRRFKMLKGCTPLEYRAAHINSFGSSCVTEDEIIE